MRKELILEIIEERWSPYSFSSTPVEEYKLKAMFEAVYTTRENHEVFDTYLEFMNQTNQLWAKNAYAIIISMARTNFSHSGRPNRFSFHDTGMAVSNLLLQALSMDIYVHQMGGFLIDKVKKYFNLGDDIEPVAMMGVGYLGDGESLPDDLFKKDEIRRSRKSLKEFAFKNTLSNSAF
jgi:nitroreductase